MKTQITEGTWRTDEKPRRAQRGHSAYLKSVGLMRTAISRILGKKSATEMSQYLYHNKKG